MVMCTRGVVTQVVADIEILNFLLHIHTSVDSKLSRLQLTSSNLQTFLFQELSDFCGINTSLSAFSKVQMCISQSTSLNANVQLQHTSGLQLYSVLLQLLSRYKYYHQYDLTFIEEIHIQSMVTQNTTAPILVPKRCFRAVAKQPKTTASYF